MTTSSQSIIVSANCLPSWRQSSLSSSLPSTAESKKNVRQTIAGSAKSSVVGDSQQEEEVFLLQAWAQQHPCVRRLQGLQAKASGTFRPKGNDDKKKPNGKFSSKAFRKELNAMTKSKAAKKKYLEKYLCALEKELEKVNASDAESEPSDNSSEDLDASFLMMEVDTTEKNLVTSSSKPPKAA